MTPVTAFYDAVHSVSKGIRTAFTYASATKLLDNRNLERERQDISELGALGTTAAMVLIVAVDAIVLPFTLPVVLATCAAALELQLLPFQLDSLYRAGKHDRAKKAPKN